MPDIGHGATLNLYLYNTTTDAFTPAEIRGISGPSFSVTDVQTSHMGSTSMLHQFIPGMMDLGEVTFDLIFDPDDLELQSAFSTEYFATVGWDEGTQDSHLLPALLLVLRFSVLVMSTTLVKRYRWMT